MNLKFKELEIYWPIEVTIVELRKYIRCELEKYGEPLRWAITSTTNDPKENIQKLIIEAVFLNYKEEDNNIDMA